MKTPVLAFVAFAFCYGTAWCADLAGGWQGAWTKDGDALPVTVTFEKSGAGYSGSFDSDALQVNGIPFADVSAADGKIHWLLKGDQTTTVFDGALDGETLNGTFVEGATHGTFALARAGLPEAKVASRDVTLANGNVTLAGTLLLPAAPGAHAAVLFMQGSGPEGRWANRYLAEKFAENGIAALIYDKRGVGASTGDWQKVGFDALADDAVAAIRFLRTQSEIDPARIGIYGHSQGGTIAPMVAAKDAHLAFVIASAAAGISPADVEHFSIDNSIGTRDLPPAESKDADAYVQALVDVGYRDKPRAKLDALAAKFRKRSWYFAPPPPNDSYWTISRKIAAFEPWVWWRQVKAPVLLIYGAHDQRVPPAPSANSIRAALSAGGNLNVTLKIYPRADHTFTIVDPAKTGGWPKKEADYGENLVAWVKGLAPHDE
jgi:dipeptidyl aminopeptidase/acylaminoacyl peptidase